MEAPPDPSLTRPEPSLTRNGPAPTSGGRRQPVVARRRGAGVRWRLLVLLLGGMSLLAGLDAGLVRLAVWAPVDSDRLADLHGVTMVLGFLGTVIALERAQALRRTWALAAPALLGGGSVWLIIGLPVRSGQLMMLLGAALLAAVLSALWRRSWAPVIMAQVLAAGLATVAAALLVVRPVTDVVPLLIAFVVITVVAERAELAQLSMGERAVPHLVGWATTISLGAVLALTVEELGGRLLGIGLVGAAAWLLADDVGRRTVRTAGQPRFVAVALLAGTTWLGIGGAGWVIWGFPESTEQLDIAVHTVFLGFAMSMVMAHAPTILPAVLGRRFPYRSVLWLPLLVLQVALAVRVVAAAASLAAGWQLGGVLTVAALVIFVVTGVVLVARPGAAADTTVTDTQVTTRGRGDSA
ncbi:hypothetical protein ACQBAU_12915 [Propionibacteriaceae bacterium Y2011]